MCSHILLWPLHHELNSYENGHNMSTLMTAIITASDDDRVGNGDKVSEAQAGEGEQAADQ